MNKSIGVLLLVAVAGLAAGIWAASALRGEPHVAARTGTVLERPRPIADFSLVDQDGQPFTKTQLTGAWTVIFSGFRNCPDVCPTTLSFLKSLEREFAARGPGLKVLFLSVDPERDTPALLKDYVRHFNPRFLAATAPEAELDRFCGGLGLARAKVGSGDGYSMDHSAALVLVNPRAEIAAYFVPPHTVADIAADVLALQERAS